MNKNEIEVQGADLLVGQKGEILANFKITKEVTDHLFIFRLWIDGQVIRETKLINDNGQAGDFFSAIRYKIQKKEPYLLFTDAEVVN